MMIEAKKIRHASKHEIIQHVMQSTFEQLQLQKVKEDLKMLWELQQLRNVTDILQSGGYMNVMGALGLEKDKVNSKKQKNVEDLLNRLQLYLNFLWIDSDFNQRTPLIKKPKKFKSYPNFNQVSQNQQSKKSQQSELSENQNITKNEDSEKVISQSEKYFKLFHDLQCLKSTSPTPDLPQNKQSIEQCIIKIRDMVYDLPKRPFIVQVYKKRITQQDQKDNQNLQVNYDKQIIRGRFIRQSQMQDRLRDTNDLKIDFCLENDQQNQKNVVLQQQKLQLQIKQNSQSQSYSESQPYSESQSYSQSKSISFLKPVVLRNQQQIKQFSKKSENVKKQQNEIISEQELIEKQKKQEKANLELINNKDLDLNKANEGNRQQLRQQIERQSQGSIILEHLRMLERQLSLSLKQQSLGFMNNSDLYIQTMFDQILQSNIKHIN